VVAGETTWAELERWGLVAPGWGNGLGVAGGDVGKSLPASAGSGFSGPGRARLRDVIGGGLMMLGGLGAVAAGLGMMPEGIRRLAGHSCYWLLGGVLSGELFSASEHG
jgi:hypothetical protein